MLTIPKIYTILAFFTYFCMRYVGTFAGIRPYNPIIIIMVRVLIVSTSERTGGAALAANHLMEALNRNGVQAQMLVGTRQTNDPHVTALPCHWLHRWHFLWERLCIFFHLRFRKQNLFQIDIANAGTDITRLKAFQEADVIHLHWVNQGMLSLRSIRRILQSGKPVVWTMHDLWPATALCHYARGCERYFQKCARCPLLLGDGSANDLSAKVWRRKQHMLQAGHITFVACSKWLAGEARKSALLQAHTITNIPNPIDTTLFMPVDKREARQRAGLPLDGRIILFVSQRVTDERKGIRYLMEAVKKLADMHPDWKTDTRIAILGGQAEEVAAQLALPALPLGYVSNPTTIVDIYNAADVFVTPSLEDNLPNTIMEAMACGVPCVGFRVGGIPEMIDHLHTGYVAKFMDSADLARGIGWVLDEADSKLLTEKSIEKVQREYSQESVAQRYLAVYTSEAK